MLCFCFCCRSYCFVFVFVVFSFVVVVLLFLSLLLLLLLLFPSKLDITPINAAIQVGIFLWQAFNLGPNSHVAQNYERADADGTLSRNEILKMKILTDMKSRTHGDCKNK